MQLKDMEPVVKKFYTGLEEGIYWARQCPACGYHKTDWVQVSGHGHLIDFTLPGPQNDKPYLKEYGKYAYGSVDIDEGSQYTYVIYGITKKKAPEIRAKLMAGETVGVHAKVIDRPGYKELTFELDD